MLGIKLHYAKAAKCEFNDSFHEVVAAAVFLSNALAATGCLSTSSASLRAVRAHSVKPSPHKVRKRDSFVVTGYPVAVADFRFGGGS